MRIIYLVPCYNEADRLDSFLESLKSQTIPIEIIAIDDGSKDGTYEKLKSSNLLHVEKNPLNLGAVKTVNRLLKIAQTYNPDFLTWSGADDNLYNNSIEIRLNRLIELNCAILLTGADSQTATHKLIYPNVPPQHTGIRELASGNIHNILLKGNIVQVPILVDMKRVTLEHLLYDEHLKHFPDWDQHLRLSSIYPYGYADISTGCSDWNETNFSSPKPEHYKDKLIELITIIQRQAHSKYKNLPSPLHLPITCWLLLNAFLHLLHVNYRRLSFKAQQHP